MPGGVRLLVGDVPCAARTDAPCELQHATVSLLHLPESPGHPLGSLARVRVSTASLPAGEETWLVHGRPTAT